MYKILSVFLIALFTSQAPVEQVVQNNDDLLSSLNAGNNQSSNKELRKIQHNIFKPGEKLEYLVHYGFIDAGTASIELVDEKRTISGRSVYRVIGIGETKWTFDWFFKVRDRYETYIDVDGVFPWLFIRRVDEGGYIINQDYKFNPLKNQVDNGKGKIFDTPDYVQDMVSAFYYARTLDMRNAKPGDVFTIDSFVDNEVYPAQIRYVGTETISIKNGKYRCLKFNPVVQKGRIFKKEEDLRVYITDDENKIPVLLEAKILVGSVKMELTNYKGLANPIAKIK
jgi:hypothetical protein